MFLQENGSSPRVWGTDFFIEPGWCSERFIPTRVGNGCEVSCQLTRNTVHPHACGERALGLSQSDLLGGSSPRVWGTGWSLLGRHRGLRFIPTRVGNGRLI